MNRIRAFLVLLLALSSSGYAVTHTVVSVASTFSPNTLTINLGDTVNFVLGFTHNAQEVSLATWNANGTTSNGGFSTPFGGGMVVLTQVGIYYYVCTNHAFMGMKGTITVVPATSVRTEHTGLPREFVLEQNYPNPFNPGTTISFALPVESMVTLKVLNVQGQLVATLVHEVQTAGFKSIDWNAGNFASGIYFCALEATGTSGQNQSFTQIRKMLLLK